MSWNGPCRVGISSEFFLADGSTLYDDIGLGRLEELGIEWRALRSTDLSEADVADLDTLLVLRQPISSPVLAHMPRLRHIARWGAGLDRIDLPACTERGILVSYTPEGGRRPVASAALALLLALTHRIPQRDRLVRQGRWSERNSIMGVDVANMTVGIVGLGTIGSEFARLVAPFGARLIAAEERTDRANASSLGVELVPFCELLPRADALIIMCPLTAETRGLISREAIGQLKPSALVVNVARGELVDEVALIDALRGCRLAGAGLDVFQSEPLPASSPLVQLENVILAPHSLAWGQAIITGNRAQALTNIERVAFTSGLPDAIANRDVLTHAPWARMAGNPLSCKAMPVTPTHT